MNSAYVMYDELCLFGITVKRENMALYHSLACAENNTQYMVKDLFCDGYKAIEVPSDVSTQRHKERWFVKYGGLFKVKLIIELKNIT